jgi:hypothetical protein
LLSTVNGLERVQYPIFTQSCDPSEHGTIISLSPMHQNLTFPSPERLKQILVLEYGREDSFKVLVNESAVTVTDIPGNSASEESVLAFAGPVRGTFTITEPKQRVRNPGIAIRVAGKIIGDPSFFGLEVDSGIPQSLLKRLYGEIEADGLSGDATADWGAIVENSKAYQEVKEGARHCVWAHLDSNRPVNPVL